MDHDHHADGSRRKTPRVLPHVRLALLGRVVGILNENVEHLRAREVLAEAVGSCALDTASGCWDEAFQGRRVQATCELLFFGLDTGNNGNGQEVLIDLAIELENLADLDIRLGFGEMGGVPFLPQELASTEERFLNEDIRSRFWMECRGGVRGFLNSHLTTLFH